MAQGFTSNNLNPTPRDLRPSEKQIVNSIFSYLLLKRIPFAPIRNTGSIQRKDGGFYFGKTESFRKGIPDIIACVDSVALAIEVKTSTGIVSEYQKEWLKRWHNDGGGETLIARSLEDVIACIERIKASNGKKMDRRGLP